MSKLTFVALCGSQQKRRGFLPSAASSSGPVQVPPLPSAVFPSHLTLSARQLFLSDLLIRLEAASGHRHGPVLLTPVVDFKHECQNHPGALGWG